MLAFAKNEKGIIVKAYDEGADIRCPINREESYYFSKWQADPRGAIVRAISETYRRLGYTVAESDIVFC